ncbi:unnamed protein product, partial [Allacma fusca]
TVRTKDGLMKRPITRLVLLPKNPDLAQVATHPLELPSPALPEDTASRPAGYAGAKAL